MLGCWGVGRTDSHAEVTGSISGLFGGLLAVPMLMYIQDYGCSASGHGNGLPVQYEVDAMQSDTAVCCLSQLCSTAAAWQHLPQNRSPRVGIYEGRGDANLRERIRAGVC